MSTIVGALACQKNSFLKSFTTTVVSSYEYKAPPTSKDKQNKNSKTAPPPPKPVQYAVELQDTILFPEGGGQPFDKGTIQVEGTEKVVEVDSVLRDKLTALHLTNEPVPPGSQVVVNLDWNRRLDVMQQHTGQHLLSAVFDTYELETLSWSMGEMVNYIELPSKVDDQIVDEVSAKVNQLIFDAVPINVVTPDPNGEDGAELDTSHIPVDYDLSKGIIRVVKIGDLDSNPCCGTHLSSTSQIQAITLLHQTNVRGGHSRLHFVCGSRVAKYAQTCHQLLKDAGSKLSCQIDEVPDKIDALNVNYRKAAQRESAVMKELAAIEAAKAADQFGGGKNVAHVYRADDSAEYLTLVQKELSTLANTTDKVDLETKHTIVLFNNTMIKVIGPKASELAPELKERIGTLKGGGKGKSFQGKIGGLTTAEAKAVLHYLEEVE